MFDLDFDFGDLLGVAGMAASAYSKYEEGKESNRQAREHAAADEKNADLADQQAKDARERSATEAEREDQRKRALIGKQRAAMGASGVAVGEGTFADILSDTEEASQEDQATILLNGFREAYGYDTRASNLRRSASANRRAGKQAERAGTIGAVGGLISGTYKLGNENQWW